MIPLELLPNTVAIASGVLPSFQVRTPNLEVDESCFSASAYATVIQYYNARLAALTFDTFLPYLDPPVDSVLVPIQPPDIPTLPKISFTPLSNLVLNLTTMLQELEVVTSISVKSVEAQQQYHAKYEVEFSDQLQILSMLSSKFGKISVQFLNLDCTIFADTLNFIEHSHLYTFIYKLPDAYDPTPRNTVPDEVSIDALNLKYYRLLCALQLHTEKYKRYKDLFEDLEARCLQNYYKIVNGTYIQAGNFVKFQNNANVVVISAHAPEMEDCPKPDPIFLPPQVYIREPYDACSDMRHQVYGSLIPLQGDSSTDVRDTIFSNVDHFADIAVDDRNFWTTVDAIDTRVFSVTHQQSNPSSLQLATAYFASYNIQLEHTTNFFYGMGAIAKLNSASLLLGKWHPDPNTYQESIPNFYKFLYQELKANFSKSFPENFQDFCSLVSTLYPQYQFTEYQYIEFYLSLRWKMYVNILTTLPYKDLDVLNTLGMFTFGHFCQRLTVVDAIADTTYLGWAIHTLQNRVRLINIEPQGFYFNVQAQSPLTFLGGQFRVTSINYTPIKILSTTWALDRLGVKDVTINSGVNIIPNPAHRILYTILHEVGHTIDFYKGISNFTNFGFSDTAAWQAIGGWVNMRLNVAETCKYPTEVISFEPPPTIYGHTSPSEDFAESWVMFNLNPNAFHSLFPKRYHYFKSYVEPFIYSIPKIFVANP